MQNLVANYNTAFYDTIGRILTDNNMDFVPLPAYINFKDTKELANVFKTYSYKEYASVNTIVKPSFVCIYIGQRSTNLDIQDSNFQPDGVDVRLNKDGKSLNTKDYIAFQNPIKDEEDQGDKIPVFVVDFGVQNQSIFKDYVLDQQEFSETQEGLKIINDLTFKENSNNASFIGQNIFNLYTKRSYSCEVEAMGNAMIQPMMYFQLDHIPMYHGAYLIIKATHNLKPNSMSTKFKGVRIAKSYTPLIDNSCIFMNLIGSMDDVEASSVSLAVNNKHDIYTSIAQDITPESKLRISKVFTNNPLKGTLNITGNFATDRQRDSGKPHEGIDIGVPLNTSVYCVATGKVVFAGDIGKSEDSYGPTIIIETIINDKNYINAVCDKCSDRYFYHLYGHLNKILDNVIVGKEIKAKDEIAKSGKGFGHLHLHFEIREDLSFSFSKEGNKEFNYNNFIGGHNKDNGGDFPVRDPQIFVPYMRDPKNIDN